MCRFADMGTSLAELPPEILTQIVSCFENAKALWNLSRTCKWLHEYTEKDGFRVFVQTRFPSIQIPPCWRDAAQSLTTLTRAWDRKAFIARCIEPDQTVIHLPKGRQMLDRRRREKAQTMGYQPVIDSYNDQYGSSWNSRKEVLAWGAGAELVLRVKTIGDQAEEEWRSSDQGEKISGRFDQHRHRSQWAVYKEADCREGRDDITSVQLLRPNQRPPNGAEHIIVGRASGGLEYVQYFKNRVETTARYDTSGRPIRSATCSSITEPLIAACLGDSTLAIYPVRSDELETPPLTEVCVMPEEQPGRTWTTRFLRHNCLAVGLGSCAIPLQVYGIDPDGISKSPVRTFDAKIIDIAPDARIDIAGSISSNTSSVYSISPLSPSSQASGAEGDLFLSGWFSGSVRCVLDYSSEFKLILTYHRLHDLRSPSSHVAIYNDPIDNESAVYSLLSLGHERFLAGGARHAILKVFDLRLPGGKCYFSSSVDNCSSNTSRNPPTPIPPKSPACCAYHYETIHDRRDWSVFLNPRGPAFYRLGTRRSTESPIYSLSAPSAYSPSIYAGVEDSVVQFDIVSMMNKHLDPVFKNSLAPPRKLARDAQLRRKWDPDGEVLRLACYEQVAMGSMRLRVQTGVGDHEGGVVGWDERWQDGRGNY